MGKTLQKESGLRERILITGRSLLIASIVLPIYILASVVEEPNRVIPLFMSVLWWNVWGLGMMFSIIAFILKPKNGWGLFGFILLLLGSACGMVSVLTVHAFMLREIGFVI